MKKALRVAVLFDCGDTLIHLDPTPEAITGEFLNEKGFSIGVGDVKTAYRIVNFHIKQSSIQLSNARKKKEFFLHYNTQLMKAIGLGSYSEGWAEQLYRRFERYRRWAVFEDTLPALTALKESSFVLGVVANWDATLHSILEELGVGGFFDAVVSSGAAGVEKPSSAIFHLGLNTLGVSADRTLYVGNEYEVDVLGARCAGVEPILIDRDGALPFADCLRFITLQQMAAYLIDEWRG